MKKKIEIFKTNVYEPRDAERVVAFLLVTFPDSRINFDLHDCDKILRIEGADFNVDKVQVLVREKGFDCCVIE